MSELVLSLFPGIGLLDMAFEEQGIATNWQWTVNESQQQEVYQGMCTTFGEAVSELQRGMGAMSVLHGLWLVLKTVVCSVNCSSLNRATEGSGRVGGTAVGEE